MRKILLSLFFLSSFIITHAQNFGIGINPPTQKVDVSGNIKLSGSLMPNNNAGTLGAFLLSGGPGTYPTWGPIFLNAPGAGGAAIATIAHAYVINVNLTANTITEITVNQVACTVTSAIWGVCFAGPLPGTAVENANIRVQSVQSKSGKWIVTIQNANPLTSMSGLALSFIAFY